MYSVVCLRAGKRKKSIEIRFSSTPDSLCLLFPFASSLYSYSSFELFSPNKSAASTRQQDSQSCNQKNGKVFAFVSCSLTLFYSFSIFFAGKSNLTIDFYGWKMVSGCLNSAVSYFRKTYGLNSRQAWGLWVTQIPSGLD